MSIGVGVHWGASAPISSVNWTENDRPDDALEINLELVRRDCAADESGPAAPQTCIGAAAAAPLLAFKVLSSALSTISEHGTVRFADWTRESCSTRFR